MKKRMIAFCVVFAIAISLFAETNSSADEVQKWKQLLDNGAITEEEYNIQKEKILNSIGQNSLTTGNSIEDANDKIIEIKKLIDENLSSNKERIQELSKGLTYSQKQMIYSSYEKSGGAYFALNLILGCGIGSFAQGDGASGVLSLCLELGGLICIIGGVNSESAELITLGYGFLVGGRVGECISPWTYARKYNNSLKSSLNLSLENLSFRPLVNPVAEQVGFMAKIVL